MATPILKGSSAAQLQYWELDFSPTQGGKLVKEYKGIDLTAMSALANTAAGQGYTGKLRYEKNVATLSLETTKLSPANLPGGISSPASDITDKWEVVNDQEKPELFENKNFLGLFSSLDASYPLNPISQMTASLLRQVAGSGSSVNDAWTNFLLSAKSLDVATLTGTDPSPKPKLYDLLAGYIVPFSGFSAIRSLKLFADDYFRGRTNFVKGKYTLRHTTSAPNDFGPNQADFNVENIYSIAQLLTECQSTTLWFLPLPPYLAFKILAYPVPSAMPPNYVWGALKMGSGAISAARNRVEITTEYLIDACPKHTYGLIS